MIIGLKEEKGKKKVLMLINKAMETVNVKRKLLNSQNCLRGIKLRVEIVFLPAYLSIFLS